MILRMSSWRCSPFLVAKEAGAVGGKGEGGYASTAKNHDLETKRVKLVHWLNRYRAYLQAIVNSQQYLELSNIGD